MAVERIEKINYLYRTSDGHEFRNEQDADAHEYRINSLRTVAMLNENFVPTMDTGCAYFVLIENGAQLDAFKNSLFQNGYTCNITKLGYYYFDEDIDSFFNIDAQIERLQNMKNQLIKRKEEMQ